MKLEKVDKIGVGAQVWLRDPSSPDSFVKGTVVERKGDVLAIKSELGRTELDLEHLGAPLYRCNAREVDDMTSLSYFHVPGILHNLKSRSLADKPYTFLGGSVLVAVNPLQPVADPKDSLGNPRVVGTPHPYAIAEGAFQQLGFAYKQSKSKSSKSDSPVDQAIVVGGESGAGKTESSKMVLRHLVKRGAGSSNADHDLDKRLLDSNPILEAFGNAVTKRNDNSSRFGKFMKLHFKEDKGTFTTYGASLKTYLLERSRVTAHSPGERTFHVFYQLVTGADKKLRKALHLDGKFSLLSPSIGSLPSHGGSSSSSGGKKKAVPAAVRKIRAESMKLRDFSATDKANFKALTSALSTIGIGQGDEEGQTALFRVLAGLLWLSNITFKDKENTNDDQAAVSNQSALDTAAELLGLDSGALAALCLERKVKAVGEEIIAKRDAESAKIALDAVIKSVYTHVFDWVVKATTESLSSGREDYEKHPFIGVLDSFGFETFKVNDFEQLLINYTNEALQSTFNQQIFEAEALLYEREGLLSAAGERHAPPNNLETMVLLGSSSSSKAAKDKKKKSGYQPGILDIIDAETNAPQPSDDKLVAKLHRTFQGNKFFPSPHPKDVKFCFIVTHYAGDVRYTIGKFIEKNVDKLPSEINQVLSSSNMSMMQKVFTNKGDSKVEKAARAVKKSSSTICGTFKEQIAALITTLDSTQASFIRCIKPNAMMRRDKTSSWFNSSYVTKQLQNLSIPQTAEVLQGGLPTRLPFALLVDTYQGLLPKEAINAWKALGKQDDRLFVRALFDAFDIAPNTYKVGLTKVFFKSGQLEAVSGLLNQGTQGKMDASIGEKFRRFFAKALWRRTMAKVLTYVRFVQLLKDARDRNSAATIMQRLVVRARERAEAKAVVERLRAEKKRREEQAARERARKLREEQERKAREEAEARSLREKERLAREKRAAEERARIEQERAEAAALEAKRAAENERKLKQEQERLAKKEQEEMAKLVEQFGDEKAVEEQLQQEKSHRRVRFAPVLSTIHESDLSAPPAAPKSSLRKSLKFASSSNNNPAEATGNAEEIKSNVKKELRKSMAMGSKAALLKDQSKPITFENVKFKELPLARPSPFACLFGAKKPADSVYSNGDDWKSCAIIIAGIELRYFDSIGEDDNEEIVGKGTKHGVVAIDPNKTELKHVQGKGADDAVIEFVILSHRKRVLFKLFDPEENKDLIAAYEQARKSFEAEQVASRLYNRGGLSDNPETVAQMEEYKSWMRNGLITETELAVLLTQQVTTEDEYLAQDSQLYGDEYAQVDFRVACDECGEVYYFLPSMSEEEKEKLLYCMTCGSDMPSFEEISMRQNEVDFYRKEKNMELDRLVELSKMSDAFPLEVVLENGQKIVILEPKVRKVYESENMRYIYNFFFESNLSGENMTAELNFNGSWEEFRYIALFLKKPSKEQTSSLSENYREHVPSWPKDVDREGMNKEDLAEARLPVVQGWVHDLMKNAHKIPELFQIKAVRKFFNIPLDAKFLANEISDEGQPLSLDQINDLRTLASELIAAAQGGAVPDEAILSLLSAKKESIYITADPEKVFSSANLAALSPDEKIVLIEIANDTAEIMERLGI